MKLPDDLLNDLAQFLDKVDELRHSDRKELLMTIMRKHFLMNESELVLSKYDFDMMIGAAKSSYSRDSLPQTLSGKAIDHKEVTQLLLIEGVFGVLNSKGALKRLPKFDRR